MSGLKAAESGASATESPKSITTALNPPGSFKSITLPGLKSRWTIRKACKAQKASQIWRAIRDASGSLNFGRRERRSDNVSP